jgi:hypothetical protein
MVKPISLLTPPPIMHTQQVTFAWKTAPFFDNYIWVFLRQVCIQSPPELVLEDWRLKISFDSVWASAKEKHNVLQHFDQWVCAERRFGMCPEGV